MADDDSLAHHPDSVWRFLHCHPASADLHRDLLQLLVSRELYVGCRQVLTAGYSAGPTAPAGSSSSVAPSVAPVYSGSTVAVTSTPAPVATTPAPPTFTGGASHAAVGAGAGLAGLLGVAAFLL